MFTIFTCVKPFSGKAELAQRNAIGSWMHLRPACEVLIIGEEQGAGEAARELGARLIPGIERSASGLPLLPAVFATAEKESSFQTLVYANADIMFTSRLLIALELAAARKRAFLLIGRRWEIEVDRPVNFENDEWERDLLALARTEGKVQSKAGLDYFGFRKGTWGAAVGDSFPPFVLARTIWDGWLVYHARQTGLDVVNASDFVTAIHQIHDYSYHPQGKAGVYDGPDSQRNLELAGGSQHFFSTLDATHRITPDGRLRLALAPANIRRRVASGMILLRDMIQSDQ